MIFCTVSRPCEIHAATVLARSVKKYQSGAKMVVCIVAEKIPTVISEEPNFDYVILAKDLEEGFLEKNSKKYTEYEAVRAIKAPLLNHLMDTFLNEDIFIYLDPYTKLFGPFRELLSDLTQHSIVLVPYCLEPPSDSNVLNEFHLLKNGNINGGFWAIRKTEESVKFLKWWWDWIKNDNEAPIKGVFIDEKWLNLAIGLFDIHYFKNPCYHLAVWNLQESYRKLQKAGKNNFVIKGGSIRSFYFADLDGKTNWTLSMDAETIKLIKSLQEAYAKELAACECYTFKEEFRIRGKRR